MLITNLLYKDEIISITGNRKKDISFITFDSRKVIVGTLFCAIKGTVSDGHNYIDNAIKSGATVIVCETIPETINSDVTYIKVESSEYALGLIASRFWDNPSKKLSLVGVTGTNGKTTTATLLYELFRKLGYKCGLISTVKYVVDTTVIPSTHTTPDSLRINELLNDMVNAGCEYCFMEVSSHSVVQHRITGLTFTGGIFTNITHDHLDYHKTFKDYIAAKQGFFNALPKKSFAIYNADDRNGEVMVQNSSAKKYAYSIYGLAPFKCRIVETLLGGMLLNINSTELWVKFIGEFNAYNLLSVYAAAMCLNQSKEEVLKAMSELHSVEGRFDYIVSKDGITAIVDYAHTPDALKRVIETINDIKTSGNKLITVVGCGGNRDKTKRPIMAQIAVENSDFTILTSDNPRFEKPEDILNDMTEGLKELIIPLKGKYLIIPDRREAIKTASLFANGKSDKQSEGDIILIAGKGHETYQEIEGVRHHFNDKEEIKNYLETE